MGWRGGGAHTQSLGAEGLWGGGWWSRCGLAKRRLRSMEWKGGGLGVVHVHRPSPPLDQGSHFSGLTNFPDFSNIFSNFPVFFSVLFSLLKT